MKKYLIILLLVLFPIIAFAQFSGISGVSDFSPWRLSGTAIQPKVSSWTLGSSGTPIGSGFFTNLTTSFITISNSVTGNLTVNGGTINLGASPNTATTTIVANGSGQLTFSAAGTNQNVVLTPSGTGSVVISTLGVGALSSSVSGVISSGTLSVGNGGTGATTFTSNGVLYGNGTSAIQVTSQGAASSILTANAGAPSFSASPTIGTSVTVPTLIGGTAVSSTLALRSTSGVGSSDAIIFQVGNNGATEAMRITTAGNVGIGATGPSALFQVNAASGAVMTLTRTTGATSGSLGLIRFGNTDIDTQMSRIEGIQDGATDASALLFFTRTTGASAAERMRITTTGNVGIGTTSPTAKLTVANTTASADAFLFDTTVAGAMGFSTSGTTRFRIGMPIANGDYTTGSVLGDVVFRTTAGKMMFDTNNGSGTAAMTILGSNGNLGIGTTSPGSLLAISQASGNNSLAGILLSASTGGVNNRAIYMDTSAVMNFAGGASPANVATLTAAGAWSNASDIAYKENIVPLNYGLSEVMRLNPRRYIMKGTGTPQVGFVAQEMEKMIPEVVSGVNGSKGISYGNLTAVLTKAIQEQQKEIDELKKEIKNNYCVEH